ncbi:MAG: hypothetical protein V5A23_01905 [Halobacteriales archaeon]
MRRYVAAGAVLLGLLIASQLAFTGVGLAYSPAWSGPTEVAAVDGDGRIVDSAVDGGTVAWIVERNGTWTVETAAIEATGEGVSVDERRTAVRSSVRLADIDVASDGDRTAIVWQRTEENEVVHYRPAAGEATVVSADALRVDEPSVGLVPGGSVVAWQFYEAGRTTVRVASVPDDGDPTYAGIDEPAGGEGNPVVTTSGRDVALVWLDTNRSAVRTTAVDATDGLAVGATTTLGSARPGGGFGGATDISVAADRNDSTVRAAWTFGSSVDTGTATLTGDAPEAGAARDLGEGNYPAVAVTEDRWIAAWLFRSRASGWDVAAEIGGTGEPFAGTLSRLPSNADQPRATFAPDPAMTWLERGDGTRLVAGTYLGARTAGPVARIAATPGRFLFIALGAAVLGAVTTPVMPWSFVSLLGAFLVSTRIVTRAVATAAVAAGRPVGGPTDVDAVRHRLLNGPGIAYGLVFGVVQVALGVYLVESSETVGSIGFSHPLGAGVLALVGTVVVAAVLKIDSSWRFAAVAAVTYNAVLWTTAMPLFL